jgi:hypothetical protein
MERYFKRNERKTGKGKIMLSSQPVIKKSVRIAKKTII